MADETIHNDYLKLLEKIKYKKAELDEDKDQLLSIIDKSNELFRRIDSTNNLKIDAKVSSLCSDIYLKIVNKDAHLKKLEIKDFLRSIDDENTPFFDKIHKKYLGANFIDFIDFDFCLNRRTVNRGERIVREISETQEPLNKDIIEEVTKEKIFEQSLLKLFMEHRQICFYNIVLDPNSYSKTIENIFCMALLVRKKIVSLVAVENEIYAVKYNEDIKSGDNHLIFKMTYNDYERLVEKYDIGNNTAV